MLSMGVQAVLVVLLLGVATTKADEDKVEFLWSKVKLTCPGVGDWFDNSKSLAKETQFYEFTYASKGTYRCLYGTDTKTNYFFYVEGHACENCFELDGNTLFMVIVGDLLLTIIMMVIVYRCTNKKSSAGPPQPSKAPPRSGGRGPPVPSPDYEALNPQTQAQGTYSTVVNRMG